MSTAHLVPPPYGPAFVGQGLRIVRQVEARSNASGWAGKDISSRWTYYLRAWDDADPTTLVINDAIAASSSDDTTGWLDDYIPCGTTTYDTLSWQIVEVDGSNPDANTVSGQREVALESWRQPILDAPVTGAS